MKFSPWIAAGLGAALALTIAGARRASADPEARDRAIQKLMAGDLSWTATEPLAGPLDQGGDHFYSIKDPSFVWAKGRWHVFCTVRGKNRPQQIEYLTFKDWSDVGAGERRLLPITDDYFCAPEVFYFAPQKKWCLLYQYSPGSKVDANRVPALSTNSDVGNWRGWTKPEPLYDSASAAAVKFAGSWIDFWIICDDANAYLFFTRDNGEMYRAQTRLADFPRGWSEPVLTIKGDIFEAGHTYKVKGTDQYLTVIEALGPGKRYYKAYSAKTLDGEWTPVAATWDKPFASQNNVAQPAGQWTESISHGELFRDGIDQHLEVDPLGLRMLIQGVDAEGYAKDYGQIPWRLAILQSNLK
ncbi:non-reducing end alpha-L-arabinofuranosidase family hydrolase [Capsulimonas corticalis]|uniref:non-reducing end alpha-L-arabinofuranosidase family hydrolase n=1 Tax=Capsulimonas corticalis TaxID=2219043 RepID=UPI000E65B64B|nr:non-reducing end alpha-L-arabinofuranosidase family hydrolase [Capsulimonas corticalis]